MAETGRSPGNPLRRLAQVGFVMLGTVLSGRAGAASAPTFERDIRPILKAHCFDCHGEGETAKGGLDVRLRRWLLAGGEDGPAIVPGKPDQSRLLRLVASGEMPKRDKKLTPEQIALIRRWISSGARTARPEPDTLAPGAGITEEERAFWSFQPIHPPKVPTARSRDRVRTPIDAFLAAALRTKKLGFAPEADPRTLIRRVALDLTGLPPTPEAVEAFVADRAPQAYERMVDRLLDSPHYGERWGRHWLDLAGYADSDGFSEADPPRPYAYKYRDYVIRALNDDKPWDEFITEQLAGDELAGVHAGTAAARAVADPVVRDRLTATGFLRMGADGTGGSGFDPDTVRNQVVADTLKIVSTSLLGLSVGCAQCHDHRYDPIPQTDYYRLRAVFEPAYNPQQWRTPAQRQISLYTEADRKQAAAVEAEAQQVMAEKEVRQKQYLAEALAKHLEKFEPALREPLKAAADRPADQRTPEQRKLLADHPSVNIHPGVLYQYNPKAADELKAMDAKVAEIRGRRPAEDFLSLLDEPTGAVPVTRVLHRGDPKQPRNPVGPGGLSVLGDVADFAAPASGMETSGRRLALARWLTSGTNPLVARVLVNRVWHHHFGRGLVGTPAEFGAMGDRPTHPELLDWLADDFQRNGWRMKRLHRLILTSTAYRQSSQHSAAGAARDPENRWYGRKPVQRLDAEAVRDAMLSVSGALNPKLYGPPVPVRPDVQGQIVVGVDQTQGDNKMPVEVPLNGEEFRRSVYIQVRRSRPLAFLHAFDAPVMEVNCERRQNSTVATQALMLMNSEWVLDQAARLARRVVTDVGSGAGREAQVERAWRLAFQRSPTVTERTEALGFLARQVTELQAQPAPPSAKPGGTPGTPPEAQALTNLCQALLSANEFLYVD